MKRQKENQRARSAPSALMIVSRLRTHPAKNAIMRPTAGITISEIEKSKTSKIVFSVITPRGARGKKPDQRLKEKTVARPKSQAAKPNMMARVRRVIWKLSSAQATRGSSSEMAEVSAATPSRRKKAVPIKTPPPLDPKAMGSVMKVRPGPLDGSRPKEKTSGKIAMPAVMATIVSTTAMMTAERPMETSCSR